MIGLFGSVLGYGTYRLTTATFRTGPRLALLQSDMIQSYKMTGDRDRQLALYVSLIKPAHSRVALSGRT